MKFYTMDWWRGVQSGDATDLSNAFRDHLDRIRDRLPSDLLLLQDSVTLHDARLRIFDYSPGQLILNLSGDDGTGGLRDFILDYRSVETIGMTSDPNIGLPGPNGFGDLGYDEPDILASGLFQHRILFSSGIELQVNFSEFKMSYVDHGI